MKKTLSVLLIVLALVLASTISFAASVEFGELEHDPATGRTKINVDPTRIGQPGVLIPRTAIEITPTGTSFTSQPISIRGVCRMVVIEPPYPPPYPGHDAYMSVSIVDAHGVTVYQTPLISRLDKGPLPCLDRVMVGTYTLIVNLTKDAGDQGTLFFSAFGPALNQ